MRVKFVVPVLASILILGTLGLTPNAYAAEGTVVWLNPAEKLGKIAEDGCEDESCYHPFQIPKDLADPSYDPQVGDKVTFDLEPGNTASNVEKRGFDVIYTADTLPEIAGFSEWMPPNGNGGCILREILPGGIYHFISPDVGFCLQSADGWNADSITGFTVEVRAKVNSYSGNENQGGLAIWATSLDSDSILLLRENSIKSFWSGQIFPMDTVSDFHTYRITVQGNSHTVFVDGVSVFTGPTIPLNRNGFFFGDGSNGAGGDAEWDCVAYTTSGAFSPSELAPACT